MVSEDTQVQQTSLRGPVPHCRPAASLNPSGCRPLLSFQRGPCRLQGNPARKAQAGMGVQGGWPHRLAAGGTGKHWRAWGNFHSLWVRISHLSGSLEPVWAPYLLQARPLCCCCCCSRWRGGPERPSGPRSWTAALWVVQGVGLARINPPLLPSPLKMQS